jgi:ribosome maturation factor RimP
MYRDELTHKLSELAQGLLKEAGAELVNLEAKPQNRSMLVRFLVDKPEGITVDECAFISKAIERIIDEKELFLQGYVLEVSSPGLDRLLKSQTDFQRVIGKTVVLTYDTGGNHIEKIEGVIEDAALETIKINLKDRSETINYKDIKKAKQKIEI